MYHVFFQCIQMILDKFKEKKVNVVTALREASDAIFPSVSKLSVIVIHVL